MGDESRIWRGQMNKELFDKWIRIYNKYNGSHRGFVNGMDKEYDTVLQLSQELIGDKYAIVLSTIAPRTARLSNGAIAEIATVESVVDPSTTAYYAIYGDAKMVDKNKCIKCGAEESLIRVDGGNMLPLIAGQPRHLVVGGENKCIVIPPHYICNKCQETESKKTK